MAEDKRKDQRKLGKPSIVKANILKGYGAEKGCNLRFQKTGLCVSCQYKKECEHLKWEREFINSQHDASVSARKRAKKIGKKAEKNHWLEECEEVEETDDYADEFNAYCEEDESET